VFRVPEHGADYVAELGLTSHEGGWLLLARSNRVRPPGPVDWPVACAPAATADEAGAPALDESGSAGTRASTTREAQDVSAPGPSPGRAEEPPAPFDPTLCDSGLRLPPVFPNPARGSGWAPGSPFLRVITALEKMGGESPSVPLPVRRSTDAGPGGAVANAPEAHGGAHRDAAVVGEQAPPGSGSRRETEELPVFPSYDPAEAVSSRTLVPRGAGRPCFELRVELLVYGEAEPGSLVRLFGQEMRVGPGGRFYLRRLLDYPALGEMDVTGSATLTSEGLVSE
jgi:hypothetical protein